MWYRFERRRHFLSASRVVQCLFRTWWRNAIFFETNLHKYCNQNVNEGSFNVHYSQRLYYTAHEKFWEFVFLCIRVYRDSGCRNYPILLKFGINVYVFSKITCIDFDVPYPHSASTRIHKNIIVHCSLCRKKCLYSFRSICDAIAIEDIIQFDLNLTQL